MVPHAFRLGERSFVVRRAERNDLGGIVQLIEDDPVATARDGTAAWDAPAAFDRVDAASNQLLVVLDEVGGSIVGTLQLTFIAGLSRRGATRVQIDAVRIRADRRSIGLGSVLLHWAIDHGRQHGAELAQLTSDVARTGAHAFYERVGFTPSHLGFTRRLT